MSGDELRERVEALSALAEGGKLDDSYVAEFSRRADFLPNVSVAQMASAAALLPNVDQRALAALIDTMWSRVKFASRNGVQVYAGQAAESASPIILPSETRSLAEMVRAAALDAPQAIRAPMRCATRCCGLAKATAGERPTPTPPPSKRWPRGGGGRPRRSA